MELAPSAPLSLLLKDLLLIEELDAEPDLGLDLLEPMIARFRAAVAELGR